MANIMSWFSIAKASIFVPRLRRILLRPVSNILDKYPVLLLFQEDLLLQAGQVLRCFQPDLPAQEDLWVRVHQVLHLDQHYRQGQVGLVGQLVQVVQVPQDLTECLVQVAQRHQGDQSVRADQEDQQDLVVLEELVDYLFRGARCCQVVQPALDLLEIPADLEVLEDTACMQAELAAHTPEEACLGFRDCLVFPEGPVIHFCQQDHLDLVGQANNSCRIRGPPVVS